MIEASRKIRSADGCDDPPQIPPRPGYLLFPVACPVAASRGAVTDRNSLGDDLSVTLVTEISLCWTLLLDLATAALGHAAAAAANNAAVVKTIDLRMELRR